MEPATSAEVDALWPSVRQAGLFASIGELRAHQGAALWHVCVSRRGEMAVLERWREHLPVMGVRGLWCAPRHIAPLAAELCEIAQRHGFEQVLSPLCSERAASPWTRAGFTVAERIVVYRSKVRRTATLPVPGGLTMRLATQQDLPGVLSIDEVCFGEFWKYGVAELVRHAANERLIVAQGSSQLIGYTLSTMLGDTATLGRLAVAPEARRSGVGTALLHESIRWAAEQGAAAISLCTQENNESSRRLYRAARLRESDDRLVFMTRPVDQD